MGSAATKLACAKCHSGSNEYRASHRDGFIKVSARINNSPNSTYYPYDNNTSAWLQTKNPVLGTCSSVNCHFESETPSWGGVPFNSPGNCVSCHTIPGPSPTHTKHMSYYPNSCVKCHTDHTTDALPFSHATSAANRGISVLLGEGSYSGGNANFLPSQSGSRIFGTCSNIYCHSPGNKQTYPYEAPVTAARWGTSLGCNGCHGNPPVYLSGNPKANSHSAHRMGCSSCHYKTTTDNTTIADSTFHINRVIEIEKNGVVFDLTPDANGSRCGNIACHPDIYKTAQWGDKACLICHSVVQGKRAAITSQFNSSNSHHIQGVVTSDRCYQCHWEANVDGSINGLYHSGSPASGSPVNLVIYGAGARPTFYSTTSAVQYTVNGTREEIQKTTNHCLGCHSNSNNDVEPFGDGNTPRKYAWDGGSVAARYARTETTRWGKYSTINGANKRLNKSLSSHGNAAGNQRGWNTTTGLDGAITDTSKSTNVQCYDCHNSHGSSVAGITSRYSSATGRNRGGILKQTTRGFSGYSTTYKPIAGGSSANKDYRNPGASLCLDCHLAPAPKQTFRGYTTPWGYQSTFGASQAILGYWDSTYMGNDTIGAEQRYPYKALKPTMGGHFGASSAMNNPPDDKNRINGLCTPCHDPHGVSPSLGDNQQYAVPLLKGSWLTSPYREDKAPLNNSKFTARKDLGREGTPYAIDQNTFGSNLISSVTGITQTVEQTGGLCLDCHGKGSLTNESNHTWKSKDRIHESVKGWKTANATVKHSYSCSKCHAAHTSSDLPRLMVTNCLDSKHKGQTAFASSPQLSGSGYGATREPVRAGAGCNATAYEIGLCATSRFGIMPLAGDGNGHIPGSWRSDSTHGEQNVACHEGSTGSVTDHSWNTVTPWLPPLAFTTIPYAYKDGSQTVIYWATNIPSSSTVNYGATTSYSSTVNGASGVTYHSVTLPTTSSSHYRVSSTYNSETITSGDYYFDLIAPTVTAFSAPATRGTDFDIPITSFTANDDTGVTGYIVTRFDSAPSVYDSGWQASPPTKYTVAGLGSYTLYPWARDSVGNISAIFASPVTVAVLDQVAPTGLANSAPANGTSNLLVNVNTRLYSTIATDALTPPVQYQFQIALDSGFTTGVHTSPWQSATNYLPPLEKGKTYYWRVKAKDSATTPNESAYTATWHFRTALNVATWTTKGDFETNTTRSQVNVTGTTAGEEASVFVNQKRIISAGNSHSLAIKSDGTVLAWGSNSYGQLGDNSTTDRSSPVAVSGLSGVSMVATGYVHSVALKSNGTVWVWGNNDSGFLGDGTTTQRNTPVQVPGLGGVVSVSSINNHTLALKSDGTVWAWGYNNSGQLGDNSTTNRTTPVQVTGLTDVMAIAAGNEHSLALKSDGTVWAWGNSNSGRLGAGTLSSTTVPVKVSITADVTAIAAGAEHSLAIKSDGTVWAWGYNGSGRLGQDNAIYGYRNTPTQVQGGLSGVTAIAAGSNHSMALKSDGTLWGWGDNSSGKLGDGIITSRYLPAQVQGGTTDAIAVAAGGTYTMAVGSDGSVWIWGSNYNSQLGTGLSSSAATPIQVMNGFSALAKLSSSASHNVALKSDNTVWTWGDNGNGQLGDGTNNPKGSPALVSGLTGEMTAVSAGYNHTLALKSDGTVWAWGNNNYGQLGNNSTTSSLTPIQVTGLTGVSAVSAGSQFSLALKSDGSVWAWGANTVGQLGDGSTTRRNTPVQVSGLNSGVIAISAGNGHSLALKTGGAVVAWGSNGNGKLGDGTSVDSNVPVQVSGMTTGVTAVLAAPYHSMVIKSDATVWAWGSNWYGQLGNNTTNDSSVPLQVPGLTGVTAIGAGEQHSVALKSNGSVWAWGGNGSSQLGDGTTTQRKTPVQVSGLGTTAPVVNLLSSGYYHAIVRKTDGTFWGWGSNYSGQLGNGYQSYAATPVKNSITALVPAAITGKISGFKHDAGATVNWGSIVWSGVTPSGTTVRFRSRGAATEGELASATWQPLSSYYTSSGSAITTPASRWLELDLELLPKNAVTPSINDFSIFYQGEAEASDIAKPLSAIAAPLDGSGINLAAANPYTISGTASDNFMVQKVEISTDGGVSWNQTTCIVCLDQNITWSYSWTLPADGTYTILSRATDASGNQETPGAGITVTIDSTVPTISIGKPSATLTASGPVSYEVSYAGADAVTLGPGDVTLNKSGTADGTISVSGSGNTARTVTISGITGTGTLGISIAAGTGADTSGNTTPATGPSLTVSTAVSWWKLNENSGTIAYDSLGINDGSITQGNWTSRKQDNSALAFNGTGYAATGTSGLNLNDFTVEMWVRYTSSADNMFAYATANTGNMTNSFGLRFNDTEAGKIDAGGWFSNSYYRVTSANTCNDGNWHHIAFTRAGSTWTLYVDGTLSGGPVNRTSTQLNVSWSTIGAARGGASGTPYGYFNGSVDDVIVHNRALTAQEIAGRFSAQSQDRPASPAITGSSPLSPASIRWNIGTLLSNQDGIRIHDSSNALKATSPNPKATSVDETGLAPNTSYQRHAHSYNDSGESDPGNEATAWTLSAIPAVSADNSDAAWRNSTGIVFTNSAGFGGGGVQYYRYAWDQNPTYTFTGSEALWSSGTLNLTITTSGPWYLHVKSYNGIDTPNTTVKDFGPYRYDATAPTGLGNSAPANGAPDLLLSTALTAVAANDESSGVQYLFEAALDPGFTSGVITSSWQSGTSYSPALGAGTTYYWHVKARDDAHNETAYTAAWTLTTRPAPAAPTIGTAAALSSSSIRWNFSDNANNETGFSLHDPLHAIKAGTATQNAAYIDETSLAANTSHTRHVHAYNANGDSTGSTDASIYTMSVPPNVTADKITSTWYNSANITFSNAAGFGDGGVQYYRYAWDQNSTHTFNDSEPQWSSGTLAKTSTMDGAWYLHVKAFNGDNIANGTQDYGPYYFDGSTPATSGLGPVNGGSAAPNSNLTFTLADPHSGIDWATFSIQLTGNKGYSKTYSYSQTAIVAKTGTASSYNVTITPDAIFGNLETISVTITAKDNAGNTLTSSGWSFTSSAIWTTKGDFENNASTVNSATTISQVLVSGTHQTDDAAVTLTLTRLKTISSTNKHTLAIKADGSVWSWGLNDKYQLGTGGTASPLATPASVAGLPAGTGVIAVATGDSHTVFLKSTGYVGAVGADNFGQLGNGSTTLTSQMNFVPVTNLGAGSGVTAIAAGGNHSLALKADGAVWAWGYNNAGQLGDSSNTQRTAPVQILAAGSGTIAIAAGTSHSLAVKSDGSVWAWGDNTYGQLGDGSNTQRTAPVQVPGLSGVIAVAAGQFHSLAIKSDGSVWAWGDNTYGQLGDGSTTQRTTPTQIPGLSGIVAVAAGKKHSLALQSNGTVRAWGDNTNGKLGLDPATPNSLTPVQVLASGSGAVAVAAGASHSMALKSDGSMVAWGLNDVGQFGNGNSATIRISPALVTDSDLLPVTTAVAAYSQSLAVKDNGTLWGWGSNGSGQLGDGTTVSKTIPFQITGLTGVSGVSAGKTHTLAVTTDYFVWAWGDNTNGRLGDGTTTASTTPVKITSLSGATQVAAGGNHSLARTGDGSVWAWGYNNYGQLGDNTVVQKTVPTQVPGLTNVHSVSAGDSHSLAVTSDGTLWAWGLNSSGQLGDGTITQRNVPVQVTGITGFVVAVSAGRYHSLAVTSDGKVWAWGMNTKGQIGTGSTSSFESTPVQVLTGAFSVTAGYDHSLAIKLDNSLWAWGSNAYGQLGDGTTTQRNAPVQVLNSLHQVGAVAAGQYYSLAMLYDGAMIESWGINTGGQLGYDTSGNNYPTPAQGMISGVRYPIYYPSPGVISNLKFNAGTAANWNTLSWNGTMPANTNILFRTRGAATEGGLASASWSDIASSGATIGTSPSQWLEMELTLQSTDNVSTPTVSDITLTSTP